MSIYFDIRLNKSKAPRVSVIRITKDEQGQKIQKNLGTVPEEMSEALTFFVPLLSQEELYQLENYLHNIHFNKTHFQTGADEVERETFYFPPPLQKALFELWKLAKAQGINFSPRKVMLTAVLNKAKAVERELNDKSGQKANILEAIGIDLNRFDKEELNKRLHTGGQALFKALVESERPLTTIAKRFNEIAKAYQKHANLNPAIIKKYAEKPHRFPKWYNTVAIDLLQELGIDPLSLLSISKVATLWTLLRCNTLSSTKAYQQFCRQFSVVSQDKVEVQKAIQSLYKNEDHQS